MGKALAEHRGPRRHGAEPRVRDAYLATRYHAMQEGPAVREFLSAECRRYRDKLASEPATDEADPDPDEDAIGARE
jgi:hypothetical protein